MKNIKKRFYLWFGLNSLMFQRNFHQIPRLTESLITDGSHILTTIISGSFVDFLHPISHSIVRFGGLIFLIGYLIRFFDNEKQLEEEQKNPNNKIEV